MRFHWDEQMHTLIENEHLLYVEDGGGDDGDNVTQVQRHNYLWRSWKWQKMFILQFFFNALRN